MDIIQEETECTTTTEPTTEKQPVSFPQFCEKSFECLFNQNLHLHTSLAECLKLQSKTHSDKIAEFTTRLDSFEENMKQAFLHYTREIMKGLDDANQVILDNIVQSHSNHDHAMDTSSILYNHPENVSAFSVGLGQVDSQGGVIPHSDQLHSQL